MIRRALIYILQNYYPRWSPRMFKATLVATVAAAFVIPLAMVALPFIEFFNGMAAQQKGKSQMTYGRVFGLELMVERPPVDGAIPRNYETYPFAELGNDAKDAEKAGAAWLNPRPLTLENLRSGQRIFETLCIACHGRKAQGDGGATGPNRMPAPPSLHTDRARGFKDGTIYHIIMKGTGKMPSYADKISPENRWNTILYVRALQRAMNPKPGDLKR